MYDNGSSGALAATGSGLMIFGVSIPMPLWISLVIVLVALGTFLAAAYHKRGKRND